MLFCLQLYCFLPGLVPRLLCSFIHLMVSLQLAAVDVMEVNAADAVGVEVTWSERLYPSEQ